MINGGAARVAAVNEVLARLTVDCSCCTVGWGPVRRAALSTAKLQHSRQTMKRQYPSAQDAAY